MFSSSGVNFPFAMKILQTAISNDLKCFTFAIQPDFLIIMSFAHVVFPLHFLFFDIFAQKMMANFANLPNGFPPFLCCSNEKYSRRRRLHVIKQQKMGNDRVDLLEEPRFSSEHKKVSMASSYYINLESGQRQNQALRYQLSISIVVPFECD